MGNLMQYTAAIFKMKITKLAMLLLVLTTLAGCENQLYGAQLMRFQPRFDPLEENTLFEDGRSARPLVADTVARGQLRLDEQLYTGRLAGDYVTAYPLPITRDVLERGQQRFNVFCAPCHGQLGDGNGMVVQRGFKQPPSFHIDRLRDAPPGYFFDVMTNGFGTMYSYKSRVKVEDRWAIVAYIHALQLSQHADISALPAEDVQKIEEQ